MTDKQAHRSAHDAADDPRNADIRIYVNGELVPRKAATVSVYDSGFLLGDGVWEGLRLYNGRWAFLSDHLDRLFCAAKAIDLDIGMDRQAVAAALDRTARANDMRQDAHARLMVTRGVKARPFQDPRLSQSGPTMVIICEHSKVAAGSEQNGIRLHTTPFHRGLPLTQDPKLNTHSKLNCILAGIHAQKAGADEALMLDPYGFVNTTNSCNFFMVRNGAVWTSTGAYCMAGITRQKVIDLCQENDIPVFERDFSLSDVYSAEEAFLTGTFGAQTPVAEIDGRAIGSSGGPGPVTLNIRALYKALVQADTAG